MMDHIEGYCYHVYNRSIEGKIIFKSKDNYEFLLRKMGEYIAIYNLSMIAYCLMPNHYHMLIRVDTNNTLSPFIKRLFNSYTQAYNKQNHRKGTIFEGSAQVKLVESDEYVLLLSRYIHLNPVQAGLVDSPGEWQYSNYLEWIGDREGRLVSRDFINAYFNTPDEYRDFVESNIQNNLVKVSDLDKVVKKVGSIVS